MYLKIKKTIGWTLKILSILFIVAFGTITYKNIDPFEKGYATTDFMGIQPYIVKSDSMNPVFYAGDAVIAKVVKDPVAEVQPGDIISYTVGNPLDRQIIIHRVNSIDEEGNLKLQGDNNNVEDMLPVSLNDVQAEYLFRIPYFGWVLNATSTLPGLIVLLLAAYSLVYLYDTIWEILDEKFLPEEEPETPTTTPEPLDPVAEETPQEVSDDTTR